MHLWQIVAVQDGLVTRQQALGAGMTTAALRHATRPGGTWQRLAPGVYATFTGRLTARQRLQAALLYAGPDSVISGTHACQAHGLTYVPEPGPITVRVPASRQVTARAGLVIVRTRRMPKKRLTQGLPVVEVDRAVLDVCARLTSLNQVRALMCESVQRGLTTPERLADELGQSSGRGTRLARQTVRDLLAGCRSAPECELSDVLARSRVLPEPRRNVPLPDMPDVTPDAWWPEARLVVEVDSVEHHQLGLTPEETQQRHARLAAAGWMVIPVSPRRIREDPAGVLREIEAAFRARLASAV